ncbi:hypothetical protein DTQ70_05890 [Runella sp. SP2]|nr:hypothetical protein DTQ70_05890 [Runella sp. SP2]
MGRVWEKVSGFFIWYQKGNPNELVMEGKEGYFLLLGLYFLCLLNEFGFLPADGRRFKAADFR